MFSFTVLGNVLNKGFYRIIVKADDLEAANVKGFERLAYLHKTNQVKIVEVNLI